MALLTKAGYTKDSSGMFENKDGSKINLDISVPQGWSDWEAARDMIVSSAKDAGIRITAKVKDFNTWQSDRNTGNFDLVIDNHYQISDNPWTYWNGIFHLPILTTGTGQTNFANFERYSNPTAWALVQKLDKTPPSNTAAIKEINSSLQTTLMKDLPMIPLWYNGHVGTVHLEVLDELARRGHQPAVHPRHVGRLPADDGHRHVHAPQEEVVNRDRRLK